MTTRVYSTLPVAWSRLITELLQSQAKYVDLSPKDVTWGVEAILEILSQQKPEIVYKDLVYMNRESKIGRFALNFSDRLIASIKSQDSKSLSALLTKASTPEYDDNPHLTAVHYGEFAQSLAIETVAMNALMEKVAAMKVLPEAILNTEKHSQCKEEVCVWSMPADGIAASTAHDKVLFLDRTTDPMVWVADTAGMQYVYTAWCFKLSDLILILATDGLNPYTKKPFPGSVSLSLKVRYHVELVLVRRYLELR
jgi:hypothetical protein